MKSRFRRWQVIVFLSTMALVVVASGVAANVLSSPVVDVSAVSSPRTVVSTSPPTIAPKDKGVLGEVDALPKDTTAATNPGKGAVVAPPKASTTTPKNTKPTPPVAKPPVAPVAKPPVAPPVVKPPVAPPVVKPPVAPPVAPPAWVPDVAGATVAMLASTPGSGVWAENVDCVKSDYGTFNDGSSFPSKTPASDGVVPRFKVWANATHYEAKWWLCPS